MRLPPPAPHLLSLVLFRSSCPLLNLCPTYLLSRPVLATYIHTPNDCQGRFCYLSPSLCRRCDLGSVPWSYPCHVLHEQGDVGGLQGFNVGPRVPENGAHALFERVQVLQHLREGVEIVERSTWSPFCGVLMPLSVCLCSSFAMAVRKVNRAGANWV